MGIVGIDDENIAKAALTIRAGGLVAFPTETVYGLGANALDAVAVGRIFAAKGRPATNPIIVHVASVEAAAEVAHINDTARLLIDAFWPGPLTLVLNKRPNVPDIVTANGPTVAVRRPRHPVAQRLLDAAGVPIAAPSANRSELISPTRAEHVLASLGDAVDLILDGGPTEVGLESTVVDVTVDPPRLLRPGMVTAAQIAKALGRPINQAGTPSVDSDEGIARSPGRMPRHYAPKAPLRIVSDIAREMLSSSVRVGVIAVTPPEKRPEQAVVIVLGSDPHAYAAGLYDALHRLDAAGVELILIEPVPDTDPWLAIRDRLTRASA